MTPYDQLPYVSRPIPGCHPETLAVSATLFGLEPPSPRTARILELGCAQGGNLLPLAAALPDARFVGVDSSAVQVEQGRRLVAELGLGNVELRHADILEVAAGWGPFDYVLCHGVWSWVPEPVREHILAICAELLSPQGVAYVSYNTLPGWYVRLPLRDLVLFHAGSLDEPIARIEQARAALRFVARSVPASEEVYRAQLEQLEASLEQAGDPYLFHEYLAPHNEPVYFTDFARRAKAAGLQYLAEAEFATMLPSNLSPDVAATLEELGGDLVATEQYLDFVRNRSFRQSLIVRSGLPLERGLDWEVVRPFRVRAHVEPAEPPVGDDGRPEDGWFFRLPELDGTLRTRSPLMRAALTILGGRRSRSTPFERLLDEARLLVQMEGAEPPPPRNGDAEELGASLLSAFSTGAVALSLLDDEPWAADPPERPLAAPLARLQARDGAHVSSLRHRDVELSERARLLLGLLDGTRTTSELDRALDDAARGAGLADWPPGGSIPGVVRGLLRDFADEGLLVRPREP